jgi:hypothetical protein
MALSQKFNSYSAVTLFIERFLGSSLFSIVSWTSNWQQILLHNQMQKSTILETVFDKIFGIPIVFGLHCMTPGIFSRLGLIVSLMKYLQECNAACCNSTTCQLTATSQCASGRCCDVTSCQVSSTCYCFWKNLKYVFTRKPLVGVN